MALISWNVVIQTGKEWVPTSFFFETQFEAEFFIKRRILNVWEMVTNAVASSSPCRVSHSLIANCVAVEVK